MAFSTYSFIRQNRDEILREWAAGIEARPEEVRLEGSVLRNHIPALLDELAAWMEHDEAAGSPAMRAAAIQHATQRLDNAFALSQLIRELRVLRTVLLRELLVQEAGEQTQAGTEGMTGRVVELARLNEGLDFALMDAIEYFVGERERRLAELQGAREALRASELRYGELVRLSPDAVIVHRNDRIEFANPAALALFGAASPQDLLGKSPLALVHEDYKELVHERIARLMKSDGSTPVTEAKLVRLDGTICVVEATAGTFVDQHGKAIQAIFRDVTERKRADEALRDADRRKSESLGVLAHELRNPLAPIQNSLYLLDHAPPGSEQAARARAILHRQTEHLTRLVDDLLDATRISHGKIELRREILDARDVVRRTCDDYRALFEQRGVALRFEESSGPVWVHVDATRLSQVVGNLLSNAVKFTPSGGSVVVTARVIGDRGEICVFDNGMGMEPEQVEHMFEPYVQADKTLARTLGGLGLGLSLVKGLVELHGGTITASSPGPGQGAQFCILFPIAPPPTSPEPASDSSQGPVRLRVLVIEDNADTAETLVEVLGLLGHEVYVAYDGRTGTALARELKPDVVLCDIGLPDISGYEVARILRADDSLRETKLVALSGYAQLEDRRRARESGFDAHLQKPAAPDALQRALIEHGGADLPH